ncbi:MAG: PLP-dependent aminotransferase family protein [Pseudomonadota bacterium]
MKQPIAPDTSHRYQEVAAYVAGLAERGTLAAGARAPSLREVSRQQRVSLSTALQAYRLLEDRGVLQARPRSGYYVATPAGARLERPAMSRRAARATDIALSGLVVQLLAHATDPSLVPLGCAVPSADLLATAHLDRFLARAIRTRGSEHNTYTEPRGDPRLREEIARRAMRWGQALAPQDIVVTSGCTEAVSLALAAVCKPGDIVAVESPTYFGLLHALEALQLKALELPTDAATGIDLPAMEEALDAQPVRACLLASSFNNPLGFAMDEGKKREILALLARRRIPLIEDDIYGDLHFGPARPRPFAALDRAGNTLYCSSFSKTVAPGWRLGWLVPGRHMQTVLDRKFAMTLCGASLPQSAFADFLSSGGYDNHLRRLRRAFADGLARMSEVVAQTFPAGTRISRPEGGFVLWVELPRRVKTRELLDAALAQGICFAPGDVFAASRRYAHCMRLSCGQGWDNRIEQGLRTLGALVSARVG